MTNEGIRAEKGVMLRLPLWTASDLLLTGYDYGPDHIISHGLIISGVISHV